MQLRNLARTEPFRYYRHIAAELEPELDGEGDQERPMIPEGIAQERIEISPRFRHSIEERIVRLERDAEADESVLARLRDEDHVRRQLRLVAAQRAEALKLRLFLDRSGTRLPRPLIAL